MALSKLRDLLSGELEKEIEKRMQPILDELSKIRQIQEKQLEILKEILEELSKQ